MVVWQAVKLPSPQVNVGDRPDFAVAEAVRPKESGLVEEAKASPNWTIGRLGG